MTIRFGTWIALDDALADQRAGDIRLRLGRGDHGIGRRIRRHGDGAAQLAHHLHRDRHAVRHQQIGIGLRPGQLGHQAGAPWMQTCIHLLGQVRHHRRNQPRQHLDRLAPRRAQAVAHRCARSASADRVGQLVQPRHRDVEREAVQRLGHRGDGAMGHATQRASGIIGTGAIGVWSAKVLDQPEHAAG